MEKVYRDKAKRRRWGPAGLLLVAFALVAAACGDDGGSAATPKAGSAATTCTTKATADQLKAVDASGDGKLTVGVITPGPRNDGAYYQALVECVDRLVKANNGTSIIVDNVKAADAATQMEALAKQNPDIIAVGASEIGKPLETLSKQYDKIFWYCNCGAGTQPVSTYLQSNDDSSEISYSAGYATGLLLKDAKKDKAGFVGNNKDQLNFEVEAYEAFKLGLKAVDAKYDAVYVGAGDFNDVQKATAAYTQVKGQGVGAVYPFLGGAHEAVVKLANADKIAVMSAGKSDACSRKDVTYQIAVKFDAGDYLDPIFKEILGGTLKEGAIREFHVGKDSQPGAQICKPTGDQTKAMDQVFKDIAAGKFKDQFFAIKKAAYKF